MLGMEQPTAHEQPDRLQPVRDQAAGAPPAGHRQPGRDGAPPPAAADGEQRRHARVVLWQPVDLLGRHGSLPAELIDISRGGAKLQLRTNLGPNVGEAVSVRLADGSQLFGAVAWISDGLLGISLAPIADERPRAASPREGGPR